MSDQTPARGALPASPTPESNTLRDRLAEKLAERFTAPKYGKATEATNWENPVLNTPADRLDQSMSVHFTASDGGSSFRGVTPAEATEAVLEVILPFITDLPSVSLYDQCVECLTGFDPGDRVSWRLRWSPQGLIHEECK